MNLYIDVLFAVNVWMNVGLLVLTGNCLKYRQKALRIFLGASVGGVSACLLAVCSGFSRWTELLFTYFFVGPAMCLAAFGKKGVLALCRQVLTLTVVSIFTGGFLNQLYFHTGVGYVMRELLTGKSAQGGSLPVLFLLAAVSFLAGKELIRFSDAIKRDRAVLFSLALWRGERRIEVTALLDTGNRLYEPLTGKPVSIGEKKTFLALFPEEEETEGIFVIPYHSIGGSGILSGRRVDKMALLREKGGEVPFPGDSFLIALKEGPLSGDGSYQLILHSDFVEHTASLEMRRKRHGHQSSSSQQVSVKNHLQYEGVSVFKEKRDPLYRGERCASGAAFTGNGGSDDFQAGDNGGERGKGCSD